MSSPSLVIIRDKKGKFHYFEPMASAFACLKMSKDFYEDDGEMAIKYFEALDFKVKDCIPCSFYGATLLDYKEGIAIEANSAGSLITFSGAGLELALDGSYSQWSDSFDDEMFSDTSPVASLKSVIESGYISKLLTGGIIRKRAVRKTRFKHDNLKSWKRFLKFNMMAIIVLDHRLNIDELSFINSPLALEKMRDHLLSEGVKLTKKELKGWEKAINGDHDDE